MATHGRGSSDRSERSDRWMKPPQAPTSAACALFIHAAQMKCSPFVCSYRGRPTIRVSLCLTLTPPLFLCMTMSMTNHGQHVKNLSWNIWAVNLAAASRRRNRVPLLVDFVFLKLVHKYCYKCVESKQLETNERSTGFPAFRLPLARPQVGCLQFMNHLKDEGPTRVTHSRPNAEPNHLSTQIQREHERERVMQNLWQYFHWATWQI